MKVISTLRKRTAKGVSVWRFCFDSEANHYFAVGGENLQFKPAKSRKHLYEMYQTFRSYGYRKNIPAQTAKQLISDPWESTLPVDLQVQLDAVAA